MKRFKAMGLGALVCGAGLLARASVVYEGFDYAWGSEVIGEGAATDGWNGAWEDSGTASAQIYAMTDGLAFDGLEVSGQGLQRPSRSGKAAISREISTTSREVLTADGSSMWFSVLMLPATGGSSTQSFALNSWGTLALGDAAFTDGSGTSAPPIAEGGNAVGVGFAGTPGSPGLFTDMRVQGVVYTNGVAIQDDAQRITTGTNMVMIVGEVQWAESGATNDTMRLYNVLDPAADLPAPFFTMVADLDQSAFNVVTMGDAQMSIFDEIRFGRSAADVGMVPQTTGPVVLSIEYADDAVVVDATNLVYSVTNNLQCTGNLADGASWSTLYSVIGVTEASWSISVPDSGEAAFYRVEAESE